MHIRTLETVSLEQLAAAHNLAFSDYLVPLRVTAEQLAGSIQANSIKLELSPGAFDGETLVGFMLIGMNEWEGHRAFYNGGTGVIPAYRGNQIVKKLYDFLLPQLKNNQVEIGILEVITENKRAVRIYEALGYSIRRKLLCFKGTIQIPTNNQRVAIKKIEEVNFDFLKAFWDWQPSWQNDIPAAQNNLTNLLVSGAYIEGILAGYLIFNPRQKRIQQFAVEKAARRQGVGTALLQHIVENFGDQLAIVNVDESAEASISFLRSIGFEQYTQQFEMTLTLD